MDQRHSPNQIASPAPNTPVGRAHAPLPYFPDETDIMYMDEATDEEITVPERPGQLQGLQAAANDPTVHAMN